MENDSSRTEGIQVLTKAQLRTLKKYCRDDPEAVARALLDQPFWPPSLGTMESYSRFDDDTREGQLQVLFSQDGDAWVDLIHIEDPEEPMFSSRFRTYFGGGESLHVRQALLILAIAIKIDNEVRPQQRR